MVDTYAMILWARANENDLDTQAKQVYDILTLLSKIDYLNPKYQRVRRKKDAREFDLTLENVKDLIIKKRDKLFPDLGSKFGFFTSLNDNESAGISISIGVSNLKFRNKLIINIKKNNIINYDELTNLFKKLVEIFNPFYGAMASRINSEMFEGYFDNNNSTPKSIFDLNYWDTSIIEKLHPLSDYSAKVYEFEKINNGYYLRFQKKLINVLNNDHIELQKRINDLVGLNCL